MGAKEQQPKSTSRQDHAERAAAALRENLRKRKAQQRERGERASIATPRGDALEEQKKWGK
jgi:hypothetical protein